MRALEAMGMGVHTKTQPRTQDAQTSSQTVEKGIDRNDSQKSALGPRANAKYWTRPGLGGVLWGSGLPAYGENPQYMFHVT